jgi:hypothetical protein
LRVVRSELLEGWKPKSKGFDVEAEMNAVVGCSGHRIVEIPIDYRIRLGEKKAKTQTRPRHNEENPRRERKILKQVKLTQGIVFGFSPFFEKRALRTVFQNVK